MNYLLPIILGALALVSCGSDTTKEPAAEIVFDDGANASTGADGGGTLTDRALGFSCQSTASCADGLVCSNELGLAEGVVPTCTLSCGNSSTDVNNCPENFVCNRVDVDSGNHCWVDPYVVVDVVFEPVDPIDGGAVTFERNRYRLEWAVSQPEPWLAEVRGAQFTVYHGESQDPPQVGTELSSTSFGVDVEDGKTYYWRVVADIFGDIYESPTWSYTAGGTGSGCPGKETVTVGGVEVPTVVIGDQCWVSKNLSVGDDLVDGYALDDGKVQRVCSNAECTRAFYTWYEAHNEYPDVVDDVGSSICPAGFRLPTRAEFNVLLSNNINGLRTAYGFNLDGQATPPTGDIELCPDPDSPMNQITCTRLGSGGGNDGFYWTSESTTTEPWRLHLVHNGGGEYSYEFRTARPTFGSSVRCIEN